MFAIQEPRKLWEKAIVIDAIILLLLVFSVNQGLDSGVWNLFVAAFYVMVTFGLLLSIVFGLVRRSVFFNMVKLDKLDPSYAIVRTTFDKVWSPARINNLGITWTFRIYSIATDFAFIALFLVYEQQVLAYLCIAMMCVTTYNFTVHRGIANTYLKYGLRFDEQPS